MAVSAPARPQSKPAARRPLFLIGIAMAVVAFLLVLILGSVIASRATAGTVQVTVLVAARDIPHRTVIGVADLTTAALPATGVPPQALAQSAQALGKVAQVTVLKGQPITSNLVAAEGAGDPGFLPIPAGWVAATIPASEQQAVGGYVAQGDVIDVAATVNEAALNAAVANPRQLTKTAYTGLHVIRVGPSTGGKTGAVQGLTSSLTVLVTPCEAPYLTWLVANGVVKYDLRASADYGKVPTGPDPSCPSGTQVAKVGPAEIDRKFGFTRG
jgi:Flp pilus assembly protein CpaB